MCEISTHYEIPIILLIIFLYYFVFESLLGKTPGKYFLKTKVVTIDGRAPTIKKHIIRSLCRIIPFYQVYFFIDKNNLGLHDLLSKTRVITMSGE
jgi:uncharacterized RDD family membrane protein YckC